MTVYVVTSGTYSDYRIDGLFSTQEAAETYAKQIESHEHPSVEEYELDSEVGKFRQNVYHVHLNASTGDLLYNYHNDQLVAPHFTRSYTFGGVSHGDSVVSAEHALKLAAEARQKHLREQAEAK
jgi:hypothetical protein